jgi:hypothetical protein
MNFLITGYAFTEGGLAFDPAVPVTSEHLKMSNAIRAYARVLDLWGMSTKFDATIADQSAQAATHLMSFLCERGGAWNATWAGATRLDGGRGDDPLQGWRVGAVRTLHAIPPHPDEKHFWETLKI